MLVDDAGHRAVPIWVWADFGVIHLENLLELADRPADQVISAGVPQELAAQLLGAARARVTGVDIDVTDFDTDELSQEVVVARIGLAATAGTRQVTAALGLALALALAVGAPVRLADAVLDRLAVPVPGDEPLTPFLGRVSSTAPALPWHGLRPLAPLRGPRPRYEPRNLAFAGLDSWRLGGSFLQNAIESHWQDYSAAAADGTAVLSAAVPQPGGFAFLAQEVCAEDHRGAGVVFSGQVRIPPDAGRAGLFLRVRKPEDHGVPLTGAAALADPANRVVTVEDRGDWTGREVAAQVPADASTIVFGVFLAGPGRIELRDPQLTRAGELYQLP